LKLKWKTRQLENAKNLIRLEKNVIAREFAKGDVIYAEGEEGDSIFCVDDNNGGENGAQVFFFGSHLANPFSPRQTRRVPQRQAYRKASQDT